MFDVQEAGEAILDDINDDWIKVKEFIANPSFLEEVNKFFQINEDALKLLEDVDLTDPWNPYTLPPMQDMRNLEI